MSFISEAQVQHTRSTHTKTPEEHRCTEQMQKRPQKQQKYKKALGVPAHHHIVASWCPPSLPKPHRREPRHASVAPRSAKHHSRTLRCEPNKWLAANSERPRPCGSSAGTLPVPVGPRIRRLRPAQPEKRNKPACQQPPTVLRSTRPSENAAAAARRRRHPPADTPPLSATGTTPAGHSCTTSREIQETQISQPNPHKPFTGTGERADEARPGLEGLIPDLRRHHRLDAAARKPNPSS